LSRSTTWQGLCSAATEAAAAAHVHWIGFDRGDADDDDAFTARVTAARPLAVISPAPETPLTLKASAQGANVWFRDGGTLHAMLDIDVPAALSSESSASEAHVWLLNQIGAILSEIAAQSGTSGCLLLAEIAATVLPARQEKKQRAGTGDFFRADLRFTYGVQGGGR